MKFNFGAVRSEICAAACIHERDEKINDIASQENCKLNFFVRILLLHILLFDREFSSVFFAHSFSSSIFSMQFIQHLFCSIQLLQLQNDDDDMERKTYKLNL